MVSPGVPVDAPPLVQARALGEPVIGEIELASRISPRHHRCHYRLEWEDDDHDSGRRNSCRRRLFDRWSAATLERRRSRWSERATPETVMVLEVSSFQLETIQTFRPRVAVVLNVTPDHLDRHRTFRGLRGCQGPHLRKSTARTIFQF